MADFRKYSFVLAFLMLAAGLVAQTSAPASAPAHVHPDYLAIAGVSSSGNNGKPAGLTGFAWKVDEHTYLTTTTDLSLEVFKTGKLFDVNSFRGGVEHIMWDNGTIVVSAKGDLGMATNAAGNLGGAFSGGGSVAVSLQKWLHREIYGFGSGRVVKTSLGDSTAVYSIGLLFPIRKQ